MATLDRAAVGSKGLNSAHISSVEGSNGKRSIEKLVGVAGCRQRSDLSLLARQSSCRRQRDRRSLHLAQDQDRSKRFQREGREQRSRAVLKPNLAARERHLRYLSALGISFAAFVCIMKTSVVSEASSAMACRSCGCTIFPGFSTTKVSGVWRESVTCGVCDRQVIGEEIRPFTDREYWSKEAIRDRDARLEARWWSDDVER